MDKQKVVLLIPALNPDEKLIAEAVQLAAGAETVLLCVGLEEILESEGMDRLHMELSRSQQELICRVCEVNSNAHMAGISACTGVDVALCIMQYVREQEQKRKKA